MDGLRKRKILDLIIFVSFQILLLVLQHAMAYKGIDYIILLNISIFLILLVTLFDFAILIFEVLINIESIILQCCMRLVGIVPIEFIATRKLELDAQGVTSIDMNIIWSDMIKKAQHLEIFLEKYTAMLYHALAWYHDRIDSICHIIISTIVKPFNFITYRLINKEDYDYLYIRRWLFTALLAMLYFLINFLCLNSSVDILPAIPLLNSIYKGLFYAAFIIIPIKCIKYIMVLCAIRRERFSLYMALFFFTIFIPLTVWSRADIISFLQVLIFLVAIISQVVYFIKLLIDPLEGKPSDIIMGIVLLVILHLNILLIFGTYNLVHYRPLTAPKLTSIPKIINSLYFGSKFVFSFPSLEVPVEDITPYIQFLFWHFYNLIVVGFFAAYFFNLISNIKNKK